jgi:hypothetical protein
MTVWGGNIWNRILLVDPLGICLGKFSITVSKNITIKSVPKQQRESEFNSRTKKNLSLNHKIA